MKLDKPQKMEMPLLLNIWREGITFGHASELVNIVGQACTYGKETWCPGGLTSYKDFKGVNWFGSNQKLNQTRPNKAVWFCFWSDCFGLVHKSETECYLVWFQILGYPT